MPANRPARADLTPAGRLGEAALKRVLGYQLAQASIVTDAVFAAQVGGPMGLKPVEYTVLMLVAENPGSTLARIARALSVTPPHVTAMVDRLESRGLLARTASATDRRSLILKLTAAGLQLARQATDRILAAEQASLPLTVGEQAILAELLHKLACARDGSAS